MKGRNKSRLVKLEATGAAISFGGGILAGILGTVLSAGAWIAGADQHPWLHGMGTALLVITIPLLIFAGYCLDWMERDSQKPLDSSSNNDREAEAQISSLATPKSFSAVVVRTMNKSEWKENSGSRTQASNHRSRA